MKRKVISLTLALSMVFGGTAILNQRAFAEAPVQTKYNQVESEVEAVEAEVAGSEYEQYAAQLATELDKMQAQVEEVATPFNGERFNTETIYDLDSIGARLELFAEISKTIATASNDLNKKVRQAHIEIGAEITKAIIIAANPFAGTDEVKGEIDKLQAVIEKARGMADVTSTDKATIYVKKALDSAIWNTRFERDSKVLGKVPFKVYNELNKKITNAVGVQLSLRSTVADVEQAIKDLDEALKEAIAQAK